MAEKTNNSAGGKRPSRVYQPVEEGGRTWHGQPARTGLARVWQNRKQRRQGRDPYGQAAHGTHGQDVRATFSTGYRLTLCALAALLAGLVTAAIFAPAGSVITGGHWIWAAVSGRMFLVFAAVAVGSLMGVIVLLRVLWIAGAAARRKPACGQSGAVIVEFAMVLPFLLLFIAMMVQSMLLMAGYLCVHYSAFCAARTAIVQVPQDLLISAEPRNFVDPSSSVKVGRIKSAAVWAVIPISCGSDEYPITANCAELQEGLKGYFNSFGGGSPAWIDTQLPRRMSYAQDYTTVTILPPADNALYAEHEDIVVHVRHVFYLSIPYMAKLFRLAASGEDLEFGQGNYGLPIEASCRLPNEGVQDYVEEEKFEGFDGNVAPPVP